MVVTNMKELCEYSRQKKLARKHKHLEMIKIYGECKGLTDKEYRKSRVRQKNSFPQQHKFTHNKMWRTNIKRYSVEQLKIIAKT
tara:strand:+ start:526 stop:777 length:252 start_codon:yes stop_codon:yes gene_type:complete